MWSVYQFLRGVDSVYAGFGNSVFLLGFVFVCSPILLYGSKKYFGSFGECIILMMILITALMTRKTFAYLIPFFLVFALFYLMKRLSNLILFSFLLTVILSGFVFYVFEMSALEGFVFESRERILMKSMMAFVEKPILGWGYANFDAAFSSHDWPTKINDDVYIDKAHSHLLEYLITSGLVGLVLYLTLLFCFYSDLRFSDETRNKYFFLVFIFYVIHSQVNVVGISEEILFWAVYGVMDG